MTEFIIPGNVPSLKNGKIWTGSNLVSSYAVKKWQKLSEKAWLEQRDSFKFLLRLLPRPYFIHLTFISKIDNAWDFTARVETIADEMTKYNWINDDNRFEFMPVPGKPSVDKINPRTIIKILKEPPKYSFL